MTRALAGLWYRAFEDERGDRVEVYRRRKEGEAVPASRRPRPQLELHVGGTGVRRLGTALDALRGQALRWRVVDPSRLELRTVSDGELYSYEIVDSDDDRLRLKPVIVSDAV